MLFVFWIENDSVYLCAAVSTTMLLWSVFIAFCSSVWFCVFKTKGGKKKKDDEQATLPAPCLPVTQVRPNGG